MFNVIKNVAKHSVIYGLSDMLSRAIGFIMIPIYTTYLTPSDYGTLELLDLTSYIIGLFLAMGIAQSVVRFYYEYKEPEKRNQMISVAMVTLWSVSAVMLVILFLLADKVSMLVFQTADYARFFNIIFITTVIGLSNEIPLTLLRIEEKSITYVSISLSKLVINLTLNILFIVKFHMGVQGILYSGLITGTLLGSAAPAEDATFLFFFEAASDGRVRGPSGLELVGFVRTQFRRSFFPPALRRSQ